MRSFILRVAVGALTALMSWQSNAQTDPITTGTIKFELHRVTPTAISGTPDFLTISGVPGDGRLFVLSQSGQVRIITPGSAQTPLFFDATAAAALGTNLIASDERGLLGLAFSPDYNTPNTAGFHKVYTFTSEKPDGNAPDFIHPEMNDPNYMENTNTQSVIREWTVNAAGTAIDPAAPLRVLMRIRKPQANHNGGTIAFGPDHYLYITLGDGGGGKDNGGGGLDGHTDGVVNGHAPGNGQDTTVVYGKILRIKPTTDVDPNTTPSANRMYQIPNNNPFAAAGNAGTDEIYAYGLRNPYRTSFDHLTGKLYAADVGQDDREEIDAIVNAGNYGWVLKEGSQNTPGIGGPYITPPNLIAPIGEYTHNSGFAVIGGAVSRDILNPNAYGKYIFGDLNSSLFYMGTADPGPNTIFRLNISHLGDQIPNAELHGFGQGPNGEVYAVYANGVILEVVPLLGDFNRDFKITNADLQTMLAALKNIAAYKTARGLDDTDVKDIGDINGDGVFNAADIKPFMELLAGNGPSLVGVPEPASAFLATLLGFAGVACGVRWRRLRQICAA